jgi:hypothetical protein
MELVYYVIRQRGGWGVEYDGICRAGRPTRDAALAIAREQANRELRLGRPCRIRVQTDGGMWEEDRSFAAKDDPRLA